MPRVPMTADEVTRLLEESQLLRVAFRDDTSTYVIPLGCTWSNTV